MEISISFAIDLDDDDDMREKLEQTRVEKRSTPLKCAKNAQDREFQDILTRKMGNAREDSLCEQRVLKQIFCFLYQDRLGREMVIDMVKVRNGEMRANSGITKSSKKGISSLNVNVNPSA